MINGKPQSIFFVFSSCCCCSYFSFFNVLKLVINLLLFLSAFLFLILIHHLDCCRLSTKKTSGWKERGPLDGLMADPLWFDCTFQASLGTTKPAMAEVVFVVFESCFHGSRSVWSNLHALSPIMRFCIGHHWTHRVTTHREIWRVSTTLSISSNLFWSWPAFVTCENRPGWQVWLAAWFRAETRPKLEPSEVGFLNLGSQFDRLLRVYPAMIWIF